MAPVHVVKALLEVRNGATGTAGLALGFSDAAYITRLGACGGSVDRKPSLLLGSFVVRYLGCREGWKAGKVVNELDILDLEFWGFVP